VSWLLRALKPVIPGERSGSRKPPVGFPRPGGGYGVCCWLAAFRAAQVYSCRWSQLTNAAASVHISAIEPLMTMTEEISKAVDWVGATYRTRTGELLVTNFNYLVLSEFYVLWRSLNWLLIPRIGLGRRMTHPEGLWRRCPFNALLASVIDDQIISLAFNHACTSTASRQCGVLLSDCLSAMTNMHGNNERRRFQGAITPI